MRGVFVCASTRPKPGTNLIAEDAEPGAIYLLHDFEGNEATVEALDEAIPVLKKQGYVFVTVAQLFEILKCTPDGHTMYTVVPDGR